MRLNTQFDLQHTSAKPSLFPSFSSHWHISDLTHVCFVFISLIVQPQKKKEEESDSITVCNKQPMKQIRIQLQRKNIAQLCHFFFSCFMGRLLYSLLCGFYDRWILEEQYFLSKKQHQSIKSHP